MIAAILLAQEPEPISPWLQFMPFVLIAVLFYFLMIAPQKNKEKRFQQMINNLKQHDRVVTTGGLHGVVVSVQKQEGLVTVRFDEATGTKVQVSLWAIDSVQNKETKEENK